MRFVETLLLIWVAERLVMRLRRDFLVIQRRIGSMSFPTIAAGGLLWRQSVNGHEIALVYRPRYQDWSLPKGKIEPGETIIGAALREVREETRYNAQLGPFAGWVDYRAGASGKLVLFWHMLAYGNPARTLASDVQECRWMTHEEALAKLTHPEQEALLRKIGGVPPVVLRGRPNRLRRIIARCVQTAERLRLTTDICVFRTRLLRTLERNSSCMHSWSTAALVMVAHAEYEARNGNVDAGWKYLHEARRQEIFGMDNTTLEAWTVALKVEAAEKLTGWRAKAIEAQICASPPDPQAALYTATLLRDEHYDNTYFKNALLRRQIKMLGTILSLSLLLFVLLIAVSNGQQRELELAHWSVLVGSLCLGAIGACLSALMSFSTALAQERIPERLAQGVITAARPLIGAVSALAAVLLLQAEVLKVFDNSVTVAWVVSLAFGFSERLVIGALDKVQN